MIPDVLAGKRIAVTGATGFLGTALVERLLRSVPGCSVAVLVRPGRRTDAAERVRREILRNDCFDRLRVSLGDQWDSEIDRRLLVMAGDVAQEDLGLDSSGLSVLASCDVVIHSAAAVSFDSPLDLAVEVNLLGPSRVAQTLSRVGSKAHLIAVSTAYVAGSRRGVAPEALLADTPYATDVDWRAEVDAARRARSDIDAASRQPPKLAGFQKQARAELGAAGSPVLADKTEKLRAEWVKHHLIRAGVARAQSLGWPDAYAYTKALGERALLQNRGSVPVTIVRPSIIESSLAEPRPGWIRGFRMAEPVIISYARGVLKEFPGLPEGVVDVIPVDLVVAAIVAVAAHGPAGSPDQPAVYHVASGARNPLRYRSLVDDVRSYFLANPLYDAEGQPIVVPEWTFPGRGRVQRQLERATKVLSAGEKAIAALPIRGRQAEYGARLEERRGQAERALSYVELYGAYAETEAIYSVSRLVELWGTLDESDRADFCFDPAVIDWSTYVHEIHLPSVVAHARVRTTAGRRSAPSRQDRGLRNILSPQRQLAVFDLENTLIASNVVESWGFLATRHLPASERVRFTLRALREAPALLALDRRDRGDFLRHFYRRYEDAPVARLQDDSWELFANLLLSKSFPAGIRRVREHRALGHRTMLITGALDIVVEPLRPLFDEVVCAHLGQVDGRFTGELTTGPPTGESRALIMMDYCASEGLSIEESVAYADSASDLPMLEAAGHAVAVNPESKLAAIARKRGWHVEQWARAEGAPTRRLPIGPLLTRSARSARLTVSPDAPTRSRVARERS